MKLVITVFACLFAFSASAQTHPAIITFLQNTTETGNYWITGSPNLTSNGILVNCQKVEYSANYSYITTEGVPSYPTGPFQDGNPSQATAQGVIFQIPLNPVEETGTKSTTTPGNIGVFINGVSLYDYRDGVAWNPNTMDLCGGPGRTRCPGPPGTVQAWNRDAIPAERLGFDCAKGHPAMGNYHHHQNPSAFDLDLVVISNICSMYDADGLYVIDSTKHSPLLGFAYDGFPIYGAYGYKNADGTGGIVRINSGYSMRNITTRTTDPSGMPTDVGPVVSATYPLGYFREDYEFIAHPGEDDFLDIHNGRLCITPEYPNGTYAYFATVDQNWNSTYPYVVGPTFYGEHDDRIVTTITEPTQVYVPNTGYEQAQFEQLNISVYPNPTSDLIAVQTKSILTHDLELTLLTADGKAIQNTVLKQGSSVAFFDVRAQYDGMYFIRIKDDSNNVRTEKVMLKR